MSNILASIGIGQLENLESFVSKEREIFNNYSNTLNIKNNFDFMQEGKYNRLNRWLSTLVVKNDKSGRLRDLIVKELAENNIDRPVWKPMHMQPLFKNFKYVSDQRIDVSKKLFLNGLCLPSGSNLKTKDQNKIIQIINKVCDDFC